MPDTTTTSCDVHFRTFQPQTQPPTDSYTEVTFNGRPPRSYRYVRDLRVVEGKPLFAAGLLDTSVIWDDECVVWGDEAYNATVSVYDVLDVIGGKPVYTGDLDDACALSQERNNLVALAHGWDVARLQFNRVGTFGFWAARDALICTVMRSALSKVDRYYDRTAAGWYVFVGLKAHGPFDAEPAISVGEKDGSRPFGLHALTLKLEGKRRSKPCVLEVPIPR